MEVSNQCHVSAGLSTGETLWGWPIWLCWWREWNGCCPGRSSLLCNCNLL